MKPVSTRIDPNKIYTKKMKHGKKKINAQIWVIQQFFMEGCHPKIYGEDSGEKKREAHLQMCKQ